MSFLAAGGTSLAIGEVCVAAPDSRIPVVLKLDDLRSEAPSSGLSPRWLRAIKHLEKKGIPASLGVIGQSLELPAKKYVQDVRDILRDERWEVWNHGYLNGYRPDIDRGEKGAFLGTSLEFQSRAISRSQFLILDRLGVVSRIFGPHASGVDDNTFLALGRSPEIVGVWFYAPPSPRASSVKILVRGFELERPVGKPNFSVLEQTVGSRSASSDYMVLQAHPDQWGDDDFSVFVQAVDWLAERGHRFVTGQYCLDHFHG